MPGRSRWIGALLLALAVVVGGVTWAVAGRDAAVTRAVPPFSDRQMLTGLWERYTQTYIEPGSGRVLDRQRSDLTTSEGQSYAMLRAVWQDDRETFDRVWEFTRTSLSRPDDALFAWQFGRRADGTDGVLVDQGGMNTASDADSDIALALALAYGRWQRSSYLEQAKPIIADIWRQEVVSIAGQPVLVAGTSEKGSPQPLVNPSYFAPYAYRVFAEVDAANDWAAMVDSSYDVIERVSQAPLDRSSSAGLPPNWVRLDRQTGAVAELPPDLNTDFGYDALRLPWRLALDVQWNDEPRAELALRSMDFLDQEWDREARIAATYAHDGGSAAEYESPAMYGGALGYFTVLDASDATELYSGELASLYDPDTQSWRTPLGYYDDNWAWFGMAMYQNALPDLTQEIDR